MPVYNIAGLHVLMEPKGTLLQTRAKNTWRTASLQRNSAISSSMNIRRDLLHGRKNIKRTRMRPMNTPGLGIGFTARCPCTAGSSCMPRP